VTDDEIIIGLTTIVVFGIGAQWVGRRVGIPSLLVLLPAGLLAGGVLDWVDPEELFGDLLFPVVTLLVSVLLYQSGLQLRLDELPASVRTTVARLVSIGLLLTFAGATAAIAIVFDVPRSLAVMTGAILVVSGPTVIGPLVRVVRPKPPAGAVLLWEGTALDPIGATLGVVVLNLILASNRGGLHPVLQLMGRLGIGIAVGLVAALVLILVISRFLVTDDMEAAVGLLFAVAAYGVAELTLSEAGLFATLTLGIALSNQRLAPTSRIAGFGETVEVLIIGTLFIVLGATISVDALVDNAWQIVTIVAILVLLVRPLTVAICLVGTPLSRAERTFIGCVDPRGVVAAATAAQFAGTLSDAGYDTDFMSPTVFGVILGTGVVYSLGAAPIARALQLQRHRSTRVALIGDDPWLATFGQRLVDAGATVLVVTTGPDHDDAAGSLGRGSIQALETIPLREGAERISDALEEVSLAGALISSDPDAVVTLIEAELIELLGRRKVHRVREEHLDALDTVLPERWAVTPFQGNATREVIAGKLAEGATIEVLAAPVATDALVMASVANDGSVDFVVRDGDLPPAAAYVGLLG
jgi:NhaP-type Na+/H+ or K+/H+ antiporter